jgi:hypothetical protein
MRVDRVGPWPDTIGGAQKALRCFLDGAASLTSPGSSKTLLVSVSSVKCDSDAIVLLDPAEGHTSGRHAGCS